MAGYTICNDLTTRSLVPRKDIPMMGTDWMRAKNFPTFFPTGPFLVPAMFVPDPLNSASGCGSTARRCKTATPAT